MTAEREEVPTPRANGPLADARVLAESVVWSLDEAIRATDPALRALHVRRALRLVTDIKATLLGIP